MIEDPADYHWSSYQTNGLGKESLEKSLSYVQHT
jgi:activator of HSP90 ATPase